jgi:hypothetical protein
VLREKQGARWSAYNDILNLLHSVQGGTSGIAFSSDSNQFMSDKKKLMIRRERDNIIWSLSNRWVKLDLKIGEHG